MTVNELLTHIATYNTAIIIGLFAIPLLAFISTITYKMTIKAGPREYWFSTLIYLATIPGMTATMLTFYTMMFLKQNILELNVTIYFFPILSMILTLLILSRKVTFDKLPGFQRLSGLMLLLGLTVLLLFFLYRLRFGIFFFGSIYSLFIIGAIFFVLVKFALKRIKQGSKAKA